MGTYIHNSKGPVHTGTGDVFINGKKVTDSNGDEIVRGRGETLEVREDGSVYVDGVKQ